MEKVGGTDGTSQGMSTLKAITAYLINPGFWHLISWTGRGKGNERKIPLRRYVHLVNFISVLGMKSDATLTKEAVQGAFTYTLLKHAPKNDDDASKSSDTSSATSSATSPPSSSSPSSSTSSATPITLTTTVTEPQPNENQIQTAMHQPFPQHMKPMQSMQQHMQPMGIQQPYFNMQAPYPWNPYR